MDKEREILYTMALTRLPRLNVLNQRWIYDKMGSATAIYENRNELLSVFPDASARLLEPFSYFDAILPQLERELDWDRQKNIQCLCLNDPAYPARLRVCDDAPLVLYYLGNADLNKQRVINMVGTRQITEYGKDICRDFVSELARLCPDCLVVSGLAYGVDIHAHRASLQSGLETVGVLAHGLNQIYPNLHRATASEMISKGGLLTEYISGTKPDKMNFVARNRIVAGMAEATVVVESAIKGGSLITARLANDYNREVFAFPGRLHDEYSAGCNWLIRENLAHLVTSAQDMVNLLGWPSQAEVNLRKKEGIQRELFLELSDEEQRVVQSLQGTDGKPLNQLTLDVGISVGQLSGILLNLEMQGVVKMMVGGVYRLL